ncbi:MULTISPECIES: hypothetical protein [Zhongshania]|jgi:2-oxoglutarate ferredoxin oxidoreductase subunit beta|uniref:Uncharacterized protein n=1 Tax=Zhongshania antarctica TaxID=641702 RepID=A0A840R0M1_9GAMM|nr:MULTISPECIES: hypothetical protein [Zhongshania]MBB5186032.1 hypothetical protein [Zhongshania antarctica]
MDEKSQDLHGILGTSKTPLRDFGAAGLCPGRKVLDKLNESWR